MSPPIGSGNRSGRKDTKTQGQRLLLRKIAAISATSGLFLNLIAILSVAHVRGWHSAKVSTAWAFLPVRNRCPIKQSILTDTLFAARGFPHLGFGSPSI